MVGRREFSGLVEWLRSWQEFAAVEPACWLDDKSKSLALADLLNGPGVCRSLQQLSLPAGWTSRASRLIEWPRSLQELEFTRVGALFNRSCHNATTTRTI